MNRSDDNRRHFQRKLKQCLPLFAIFSLSLFALLDDFATDEDGIDIRSRQLKSIEEVSDDNEPISKYKILCAAERKTMKWGSYLARCGTFKRWVDQCASSVELSLRSLPPATDKSYYNATMFVKGIPPARENLGKTFIDVVDAFEIKGEDVPDDFEVIVQNGFQSEVFPDHKTHIIEHWYNSDPSDTYVFEIVESSPLRVGAVCFDCPAPDIPESSNVNFTMIDEMKEGQNIREWFVKFMESEGWTEEKMTKLLDESEYGAGMLYYHVFRALFDVMIVTPKGSDEKQRYGSIQRVVSVMKSGVPVLVEVGGPAFEAFVKDYDYSCVYSKEGGKYPSLEEAFSLMQDVSQRQRCQEEGLRIAENFSPDYMVKRLLRTLGYSGNFEC